MAEGAPAAASAAALAGESVSSPSEARRRWREREALAQQQQQRQHPRPPSSPSAGVDGVGNRRPSRARRLCASRASRPEAPHRARALGGAREARPRPLRLRAVPRPLLRIQGSATAALSVSRYPRESEPERSEAQVDERGWRGGAHQVQPEAQDALRRTECS